MAASILVSMLFFISINCGCILFSLIDCGEPPEDEKYNNLDKFSKELEDYERKIEKE
jgi:hypothetical protein